MTGADLQRANVNVPPAVRAATTVNGTAYDLQTPGRHFTAFFATGQITGSSVHVTPLVQTSTDGSAWTTLSRNPLPDMAHSSTSYSARFVATFRYVRARIQITGNGPPAVPCAAFICPTD